MVNRGCVRLIVKGERMSSCLNRVTLCCFLASERRPFSPNFEGGGAGILVKLGVVPGENDDSVDALCLPQDAATQEDIRDTDGDPGVMVIRQDAA